ncbi:NifB/NifX family molybdenum-iron cluster-binding protein [Plasticicumulans acidivorans]|uniref:Nitrogen fixation protein NifX n=1 Tax=Plasticicumulans acidivorans TaxID=886464 RepID=A0A317MTP6_9GAMM|nr:NifB/NifX family molybdenum-iron cluster-binding protein [Plasticicumulans acidivorans]PWV60995.1 nitrogen fixation protein NifX [Plasticicumulans acidivorans]
MSEIGHLKIAITTNDLLQVDANFANAKQIVFYDVTYDDAVFVDCVQFKGGKGGGKRGPGGGGGCSMGDPNDGAAVDQVKLRVDALEGCAVLFTRALSDFAAVNVKNAGVFPVKMETGREITEVIETLQRMMNNHPPLWLRKALGYGVRNAEFLIERDEA